MENICLNGVEWMRATFFLLTMAFLSMLVGFILIVRKKSPTNTSFTLSMLFPFTMAFFMLLTSQLSQQKVSCESLQKLDLVAWPTAIVSYFLGTILFYLDVKRKRKA